MGVIHKRISELMHEAQEKGRRIEQVRCADIAGMYPLDMFSYSGDTGELLRLRDAISEAILKGAVPGVMIS